MDHLGEMAWPPGLYNGLGWCLVLLKSTVSPPPAVAEEFFGREAAQETPPPLLGENFNPH